MTAATAETLNGIATTEAHTESAYSTAPRDWGSEPDFQMGFEWLGRTAIPAHEMSRHWLIMGETGSGKTRSCVMPLLDALLGYGR